MHRRGFIPWLFALGVACIESFAPLPGAAQSLRVPNGFAVQPVVREPFASNPVGFAFLPDGRVLILEKDTGNVRLAAANASTSSILLTIPGIRVTSEGGLLGVAVDPMWPARPYVYFHTTHADTTIHITMYTASGDLSEGASTNLTLASPYIVFKQIPDIFENHNGGTLRFGPDGYLYVSLGEDSRSCDAQVLSLALGKIMRLDVSSLPGSGSGPPPLATITPSTNPFPGPDPIARLVYAYGLRNPFRFTIDPRTNNLYIGDVGYNTWEEEDELVYAGYTGNNYGWPEFEGPLQDPHGPSANCSTGPFVVPIDYYPNPPGPGVSAIVGGPLYRGDPHAPYAFPRVYDGDLFVCEFYAGWVRRLRRGPSGWTLADSVPGQPSASNWAANMGNIADIQVGPDGAIYYVNMFTGAVPRGLYRILNTLPSDVPAWTGSAALRARSVPNPSRASSDIVIEFEMARAEAAWLRIYDAGGRHMRTMRAPPARSGSLRWDGRTREGSRAAPGLYFFRLETRSGGQITGKISLVR